MTNYIEQTLVFIGAAVVMVPIFHKLGFGSVLGYLIGGIIVGPFGLGLIHDSESVLHFAELGVVLLLFIIGLEIQPPKLWGMRKSLIGLGATQVILCSIVFSGIGYFAGLPIISASVLGLALSLSSTAFAIQTLTERSQFNTEFGRSSFSVLLTQDLVAIPALAIIPLLGSTKQTEVPSILSVVSLLLIVGALVVSSRVLIRPLFTLIASLRKREIFTALTLFIVLGVAVLMEKIGLSAALGTFVAGVLLADSEYRHELEANLEPFKSLLMGLFFIAVGMGVSLKLIIEKPFTIFGLAVGYLVIKFSLIYFVGRLNRMNHENSKLMSLSISQGGEFAFVIFGIAGATNLLPQDTIILLTAIISITMALSPVLNLGNDFLQAKLCKNQNQPEYDIITDESAEIIVAGLGRVGQIFARVLRAQQIPFVAIDCDPNQIDMLKKFGHKVYYGDVARQEILEAAGAARAKYLILVVDDIESSIKTVDLVQEHFPNLKIFARARNRGHVFDLMERGVQHIKRETFESSVSFIGELLVEMGHPRERTAEIISRFKRHDEIMMREQFKVRKDDKQFFSVSKQATAQLGEVLNNETYQSYLDLEAEKNNQTV